MVQRAWRMVMITAIHHGDVARIEVEEHCALQIIVTCARTPADAKEPTVAKKIVPVREAIGHVHKVCSVFRFN